MHTIQASTVIAQRLRSLSHLYEQGIASELMERTLDKLLAHEAEVCRAQLNELQAELAEFELRYQLTSSEFYQRYQAGQTDDRMDFVEWASLAQISENLQGRLRLLVGEAAV